MAAVMVSRDTRPLAVLSADPVLSTDKRMSPNDLDVIYGISRESDGPLARDLLFFGQIGLFY
jgi:hypothetical protein